MRTTFLTLSCFAVLAVSLSVGSSVYAQQTNATPSQTQRSMQEGNGGWNGECPERQELREEREKIRDEHEELESEHDRLKAQCMDSKGQERSECVEKKQALHERIDALHERMKVLHDKAEADPGCHHEHKGPDHNDHKGPWPSRQGQTGGAPQQPPPMQSAPVGNQ